MSEINPLGAPIAPGKSQRDRWEAFAAAAFMALSGARMKDVEEFFERVAKAADVMLAESDKRWSHEDR